MSDHGPTATAQLHHEPTEIWNLWDVMTCSSVERRRFLGWCASSTGSLLEQFLYHRLVFPPSLYYSAMKTNEEDAFETIVIIDQTTRCHIAQNKSAKLVCCL